MSAAAHSLTIPPARIGPAGAVDRPASLGRNQVVDILQESAFDRLVRLAALSLDVPAALISLIDAERQWIKAGYGLDAPQTPRAIAFCDHAIRGEDVFVVPDARFDPRFYGNPPVTGDTQIRFYAGAPLTSSAGLRLGTISVIDSVPRELNSRERAILATLAEQVVHELEAHAHDTLAALGPTARGIAHELNNLLQPIIGLTRLELDLLPDNGTIAHAESRDGLAMVLESAHQARNVVRKLLMFAHDAEPVARGSIVTL